MPVTEESQRAYQEKLWEWKEASNAKEREFILKSIKSYQAKNPKFRKISSLDNIYTDSSGRLIKLSKDDRNCQSICTFKKDETGRVNVLAMYHTDFKEEDCIERLITDVRLFNGEHISEGENCDFQLEYLIYSRKRREDEPLDKVESHLN